MFRNIFKRNIYSSDLKVDGRGIYIQVFQNDKPVYKVGISPLALKSMIKEVDSETSLGR